MKEYDVIAVGTGSAMMIVSAMLQGNHHMRAAVIDKDEPGGICLTRGCIPTKILLYPAEMVRTIQRANLFGIKVPEPEVDFKFVMERMRRMIGNDINSIRRGLSNSQQIDYYHGVGEFTGPYTMKVGGEEITSKMIFLCTGSSIIIPPIKGIDKVSYLTSDTVLDLSELPESIVIVGGGYIAAEFGHFLASMGSKVTILGRNPQFLPGSEPEIADRAMKSLQKNMDIFTDREVLEVKEKKGMKRVTAKSRTTGETTEIEAHELLIAAGRGSNSDILKPEKAGIETLPGGWIKVDDGGRTSQPGIWSFGDANGKFLFKHVANAEAIVVFRNAVQGQQKTMDYHAVPWAVFTYPVVAGVGMSEAQAVEQFGADNLLIGHQDYKDCAKGDAMELEHEGYFMKVIIHGHTRKILGAQLVGPEADVLIQEVINLMYTKEGTYDAIRDGMHIHPSLSEVVERAFGGLMPRAVYRNQFMGEPMPESHHGHGGGHGHQHSQGHGDGGHEHGGAGQDQGGGGHDGGGHDGGGHDGGGHDGGGHDGGGHGGGHQHSH